MQIEVRISDNVLDPEDWPIRRLTIENGVVTAVEDVKDGIYAIGGPAGSGPDVGWTVAQIEEWSEFDPTGSHPESYHDVRAIGAEKFESPAKIEPDGRVEWGSRKPSPYAAEMEPIVPDDLAQQERDTWGVPPS